MHEKKTREMYDPLSNRLIVFFNGCASFLQPLDRLLTRSLLSIQTLSDKQNIKIQGAPFEPNNAIFSLTIRYWTYVSSKMYFVSCNGYESYLFNPTLRTFLREEKIVSNVDFTCESGENIEKIK